VFATEIDRKAAATCGLLNVGNPYNLLVLRGSLRAVALNGFSRTLLCVDIFVAALAVAAVAIGWIN
jgi:hypothetical protein